MDYGSIALIGAFYLLLSFVIWRNVRNYRDLWSALRSSGLAPIPHKGIQFVRAAGEVRGVPVRLEIEFRKAWFWRAPYILRAEIGETVCFESRRRRWVSLWGAHPASEYLAFVDECLLASAPLLRKH